MKNGRRIILKLFKQCYRHMKVVIALAVACILTTPSIYASAQYTFSWVDKYCKLNVNSNEYVLYGQQITNTGSTFEAYTSVLLNEKMTSVISADIISQVNDAGDYLAHYPRYAGQSVSLFQTPTASGVYTIADLEYAGSTGTFDERGNIIFENLDFSSHSFVLKLGLPKQPQTVTVTSPISKTYNNSTFNLNATIS